MTPPRRVVVTGGTGALGRAVVLELLGRGARIAVPYVTQSRWEELLRAAAPDAPLRGWRTEIADPSAAADFMGEAVPWLGGLDGVAAIAGAYAGSGPLEKAPVEEWERMLRANLATAYAACRAALPHLAEGASVVTVGARLVETGGAGAAGYVVSKAAVAALTRVLALESRDRGIRFNCVAPAIIDTPDNRRAMPKADTSRWTSPEAIARVIAFLLSPDSAPVTGALIPVDGRG